MIYPGTGPSSQVIALRPAFHIEDEQRLQWGEQRARKVYVVKGEMISYTLPEG
jgi:hypothetical protein